MQTNVNFAFCIHIHQPTGNYDEVIEKIYQKAYLPFIQTIKQRDYFKFSMHISGCLLDWIEEKHPEYIEMLKELIDKNRLEIIGGGIYEPILPSLTYKDRALQIKTFNNRIKDVFGEKPEGLWLPERIWSEDMPETLNKQNIKYTLLDDYSILPYADNKPIGKIFETGRNNASVNLFPISEKLRYLIPFAQPEETINYLNKIKDESDSNEIVIYADDGEKFGSWPKTYQHVYKNKWLEKFLDALENNRQSITTVLLKEVNKNIQTIETVYIPTGSYREMTEWAMTLNSYKRMLDVRQKIEQYEQWPFVKAGIWHNFIKKYKETRNMYEFMQFVSEKVSKFKGIKELLTNAQKHLMLGQCNCAYWHGVFGGIYLPHLRIAVYQHLIKALNIIKRKNCNASKIKIGNYNKYYLNNNQLGFIATPQKGGALSHVCSFSPPVMLTNVLKPHIENYYHQETNTQNNNNTQSIHDIAKSPDLTKLPREDNLPIGWFKDYVYNKTKINDFENFYEYRDLQAIHLTKQKFELKRIKNKNELIMEKEISEKENDIILNAKLEKMLSLNKNVITGNYKINNAEYENDNLMWGIEFDIITDNADTNIYKISKNGNENKMKDVNQFEIDKFEINTDKTAFIFDLNTIATVFIKKIFTYSQREGGFEKNFQGITIILSFEIEKYSEYHIQIQVK